MLLFAITVTYLGGVSVPRSAPHPVLLPHPTQRVPGSREKGRLRGRGARWNPCHRNSADKHLVYDEIVHEGSMRAA